MWGHGTTPNLGIGIEKRRRTPVRDDTNSKRRFPIDGHRVCLPGQARSGGIKSLASLSCPRDAPAIRGCCAVPLAQFEMAAKGRTHVLDPVGPGLSEGCAATHPHSDRPEKPALHSQGFGGDALGWAPLAAASQPSIPVDRLALTRSLAMLCLVVISSRAPFRPRTCVHSPTTSGPTRHGTPVRDCDNRCEKAGRLDLKQPACKFRRNLARTQHQKCSIQLEFHPQTRRIVAHM